MGAIEHNACRQHSGRRFRHRGESLRFLYGRSLVSTGTTLQLAGYRYSTRGFHTLDDTALKSMAGWTGDSEGAVDAAGRPVKRDWINYYNLNNNKRERLPSVFPSSWETSVPSH